MDRSTLGGGCDPTYKMIQQPSAISKDFCTSAIWVEKPKNMGVYPPKSSILILIGISRNKPSILGYPYFWKHPFHWFHLLKIVGFFRHESFLFCDLGRLFCWGFLAPSEWPIPGRERDSFAEHVCLPECIPSQILDLLLRWLKKITIFPKWWCKMVIYHGRKLKKNTQKKNTRSPNISGT